VLLVATALAIAGRGHAQSNYAVNYACENCDALKEVDGTPMTMRASE